MLNKYKMAFISSIKIYILFIAVSLCGFTARSASARQMKFCPKVLQLFVDSGGSTKEDFLNHKGYFQSPVPFAYVRLTNISNTPSSVIWDGYINAAGCTDYVEMESNVDYEVVLHTRIGTVGNRTVHIPKDGDQQCGYWCKEPYFEYVDTVRSIDNLDSLRSDKWVWKPNYQGPRIQLMLTAGRMLANYDILAYPADTTTIFKIDGQSSCDQGQYGGAFNWGTSGLLCATSTNNTYQDRHLATDAAFYKFVTAHELGHRVQYAHDLDAPIGNYSGYANNNDEWVDDPSAPANWHNEPLCRCDQVQPADGSKAHCFQSREAVGDAIGEGYAHFFASAMFNSRPEYENFDPLDCWFAYPKQGWTWAYLGNDVAFLYLEKSSPVFHFCSNVKPLPPQRSSPSQGVEGPLPHMETFCNPGSGYQDLDVGVERDWLSFYWSLYADDRGAPGDHRFSVEDVLASLGEGNGNYSFQKSYNEVRAKWYNTGIDPAKYDNFSFYSVETGVAHCEGGCVF